MATARFVAIIDGGIGSLTVANTLMHAGMSVSLYERSPYFIPTAEAAVALQPNGQMPLTYIGFKEDTDKIVHSFHKWQIINDNGEALSISHRLGEYGKRFGYFHGDASRAELAPPPTSDDVEWTRLNNQRELSRFLKRFPDSHPIHQCAAVTDKQRLLHYGLYYPQYCSDGWHRDRICLLGDSCHATLPYVGQGVNMAIEDTVSVTSCLKNA